MPTYTHDELFGTAEDSTDAKPVNERPAIERPKNAYTHDELFGQAESTVDPNAPDFIPGVQRGLQNLQAMTYGAGALAGGGLKKLGMENVGQAVQDFGMEGYQRNIEEAKQYPKKHSFKDIYTGETGVGGAIDWAQGTLGELVPSMVEAAGGAAIGSLIAPGAGTAAGAFAGRTLLKKGIEKTVQQAMKKGAGKLTEAQIRKAATRQALKKLGGKAGIGAAVMPMESGGMYADLLEEKGVDAPGTALFFGALATSLEFAGGNSKLVDTFVDALGNGIGSTVKKSAKEILTNIPQEAMQEGGQELFGILNTVANTDEKLLTAENVEQIVESMAAGAVGGGAGAVMQAGMNTQGQEPVTEPNAAESVEASDKPSPRIEDYPGQFADEQAQAEVNRLNQFRNSPEGSAYKEYNPDLPITEEVLRKTAKPIEDDITASVVEDAKAFVQPDRVLEKASDYAESINDIKNQDQQLTDEQRPEVREENVKIAQYTNEVKAILNQRFDKNEQVLIDDYWTGVKDELNLRQEEMTPGTEAFLRKRFFDTKLAEIEGNVKQDTESKADPNKKDTLSLAEQNKRQSWFREVAEDLGDLPTEQTQAVDQEGTDAIRFGSEAGLQSEQPPRTITNEFDDVVDATGTQVTDPTDTAIEDAEAFIQEEAARKYNLDRNRQGQRESYPGVTTDSDGNPTLPVDAPIKNVVDEVEYSVYNPESPLSLQREDDVINNNSKPYKVVSPLKKKLDSLPDSENYEVIETADGFVGRRIPGTVKLNEIMITKNVLIDDENGGESEVELQMPADVALKEADTLIENLYKARGCLSL